MKIEGSLQGMIDSKRFYLDGLTIKYVCPKCGKEHIFGSYLSYPAINVLENLNLYCYDCEHNWSVKIKLNISLEVVEDIVQEE